MIFPLKRIKVREREDQSERNNIIDKYRHTYTYMYEYERVVQDNGGMTSRNNNREYVNVFVAKCLFMHIHKKQIWKKLTLIGKYYILLSFLKINIMF